MAILDVVLENISGGRCVVTMITRILHALVDEPRVRLEIGLRRGLEGALITVVASLSLMLVLDTKLCINIFFCLNKIWKCLQPLSFSRI